MNRPTNKQYAEAIISADNWRKNYDMMKDSKNMYYWEMLEWMDKAGQRLRHYPFVFLAGMLTAALGILLVAQAF